MKAEGIAIIVSMAALGVAAWAAKYNKVSARAAEQSSIESRRSADTAAQVAAVEHEREHDRLRPTLADLTTTFFRGFGDEGMTYLLMRFTAPRTYRITAEAARGDERWALELPEVARAGETLTIVVEQPFDPGLVHAREIDIMFSPPRPADGGEPWSCPCDRPAGAAHWRLMVTPPLRVDA